MCQNFDGKNSLGNRLGRFLADLDCPFPIQMAILGTTLTFPSPNKIEKNNTLGQEKECEKAYHCQKHYHGDLTDTAAVTNPVSNQSCSTLQQFLSCLLF